MKKIKITAALLIVCIACMLTGCGAGIDKISGTDMEMTYRGVYKYGAKKTDKDHKNDFVYRFEMDGKEKLFKVMNGTADKEGNYDYPIQNQLKEGYTYLVTVDNGTVTGVSEVSAEEAAYTPAVSGVPGEKTLKNFLMTALEPVGTTLYIYGGGWDWQDVGSAIQTRTLGVSSDWRKFFLSQDENYTYKDADNDESKADPKTSFYPYGGYNEYYYAGLDCSGYLGWVLYNTFETESGKDGYVGGSTGFAKRLYEQGLGEWTQDIKIPDGKNGYEMKPGDIMSINGHVWISLGTCEDGSIVLLHSSPTPSRAEQPGGGVQISAIGTSKDCEAYKLADQYVAQYYPEWYERYPVHLCDPEKYFTFEGENAGRFTWSTGGDLKDPEHIQEMSPEEVLKELFG